MEEREEREGREEKTREAERVVGGRWEEERGGRVRVRVSGGVEGVRVRDWMCEVAGVEKCDVKSEESGGLFILGGGEKCVDSVVEL